MFKHLSHRFFISAFLVFCLLTSCEDKQLKTGYIDINKVYAEYKEGKAYKGKLDFIDREIVNRISNAKKELDSLKSSYITFGKTTQEDLKELFQLQNNFDTLRSVLFKQRDDSSRKYNNIIQQKVNKLVYEYGQKHNFHYVFSPANTNVFMFADSALNITEDVIQYINK